MDSRLIDWSDIDDMQNKRKSIKLFNNSKFNVSLSPIYLHRSLVFCSFITGNTNDLTHSCICELNIQHEKLKCALVHQSAPPVTALECWQQSVTHQSNWQPCLRPSKASIALFSVCFFIFPSMLAYVAVGTAVHIQLWLHAHIRASPLSAAYTDSAAQRRWCDCVCVWLIHYVKVFQWSERNNILHIFV